MKTYVIFATQFGNTEKIARAIAEGCKTKGDVSLLSIEQATNINWPDVSLFIVGSPTQGGRATVAIQEFLQAIPSGALASATVAAFDTRFKSKDHNFALRMLMKVIDYAAPRILMALEKKGGKPAADPEGFFVTGKEGPLLQGELERAKAWGQAIVK